MMSAGPEGPRRDREDSYFDPAAGTSNEVSGMVVGASVQARDIKGGVHVHQPALYSRSATGKMTAFRPTSGVAVQLLPGRRWLAVLGSVGQPRDRNPAACYVILDTERRPDSGKGAAALAGRATPDREVILPRLSGQSAA